MIAIRIYLTIVTLQFEEQRSSYTVGELLEIVGCSKPTLHRYLSGLVDLGLLMRVKRGHYAVSSWSLSSELNDIHRDYDRERYK